MCVIPADTILRCFHRTFLCTPPAAEARAKNWPVSILHDTLYIGAAKINPASAAATAAAASSAAAASAAALTLSPPPQPLQSTGAGSHPPLTAQDQLLVQNLSQATGIDTNLATQLLLACHGNMEKAAEQVTIMRANRQIP